MWRLSRPWCVYMCVMVYVWCVSVCMYVCMYDVLMYVYYAMYVCIGINGVISAVAIEASNNNLSVIGIRQG